jgi:N-acetylglucosaminyl-diphospho-decaprenol L-rhamnosyltransferase
MKVNVVVVTFNNEKTIEALFRGLVANSPLIEQIVFVDNGSLDKTFTLLEKYSIKHSLNCVLVNSENVGFAAGYQKAGSHIRRPELFTLCLNPDVEIMRGTLEALSAVLEQNEKVAIATAPLVLPDGRPDLASVRNLPSLKSASLHALMGRFFRNSNYNPETNFDALFAAHQIGDRSLSIKIPATTGALMLVNSDFRLSTRGIFDTDYWMYGEDLQICHDANRTGWQIRIANVTPSIHHKGTSSGLPRSFKSNLAFHNAMITYYLKNLQTNVLEMALVICGVYSRLILSVIVASISRQVKHFRNTDHAG